MVLLDFCSSFFERNVFNTEELVPSYPSVGFPLLSPKDEGCGLILKSCLRLAWFSVMNESFSSSCRYQDHRSWPPPLFLWKMRLFMFLSSWDAFLLFPILDPSTILVPVFSLGGASFLVGQVLYGLLIWLVFTAIPTAGIWGKQPEF